LFARTVTLKVRYSDFTTVTRSHTDLATQDARAIAVRAVQLLDRTEAGQRPVRLLGVSVHNIVREPLAPTRADGRLPFDRPDASSGDTETDTEGRQECSREHETES
jgi:DNA polymerase-4